MTIEKFEFTEIEKAVAKTNKLALDYLAPEIGKAYVISITRDGCPACERLKPKLEKLAKSMNAKHGKKAVFKQIRVRYSPGNDKESQRSKDLLRHYFYPTTLVVVRTKDRGAIELYRSVSSATAEMRKSVETALKIASALAKNS